MNRTIIGSVLSCALLVFAFPASAQEEIKISAGPAPLNHVFKKLQPKFESETGIKLVFTKSKIDIGAESALMDIEEGRVEAGSAAVHWDAWMQTAKEKKLAVKDLSVYKQRVIGRDEVKVVTYPRGPKEISESQLEGLLTGRIKNWKELPGGEDQPVKLLLTEAGAGTTKFVREKFLGGKDLRKDVTIVATVAERSQAVVSTPGAFTFGNSSIVIPGMNVPRQPFIGRPITLIWKGEPSKNLLKLLSYINAAKAD